MNVATFRSGVAKAAIAMAIGLGAGDALALNVLTFDAGNPERNTTIGSLGFSVTQVGASGVASLDFAEFDVIYVARSYEEFFSGALVDALGARAGDLAEYVANGGGLVFGNPASGGGSGTGVNLPSLELPPIPAIPGLTIRVTPGGSGTPGGDLEAVPEPGTYALMGLGLAGLALLRRRKRA